jgi:DNA transformation protein and related proteins
MSRPVSSLPNLGPRSDEAFGRAGLSSADEIVELGADAVYARLLAAGTRAHFMGYIALALAVQGRPWKSFDPCEKPALRIRFEAIKAAAAAQSESRRRLEAVLDRIGVVTAGQPTSSSPEKK